MAIKMTKERPTQVGWYYYSESENFVPEIVEVYLVGTEELRFAAGAGWQRVCYVCGYWAKLEDSHFIFED